MKKMRMILTVVMVLFTTIFAQAQDSDYFAGDWKVLVMALGHSDDYPDNLVLNVHSPYTKSTLTIVSEPGTILIALASISALGLYGIRHKMKKKPAL